MASIVVGTLRAILTLDSAQYEAGMRKMSDSAGKFSTDARKMGRAATDLGASLTKTVTLPLLALGGASAKAAMDFESSFAGVRKTVNATDAEFAVMAQSLRNLAKEIPVNVNELNRLAEAAGAMGIPKAAIVDFSKTMALLGVTTNLTSEQAAESIGKIQNQFRSAGKDTDRFAATLVALGNDGASTESQILEMATRISSAGNTIGLTQGEVLGFANALSSVGLEAEAGGTAISRVFVDIAASVSKGGKELAQFANVAGKPVQEFAQLFKDDAATAVRLFIEGLGKIKDSGGDLLGVLAAMGITEVRLRDTLLRAAGAGDLLKKSLDLQAVAWRENSALTEEARKRFETTSSQLTLLWNRIQDVGITLGNALLPMIKAASAALSNMLPFIEKAAQMFAALPVGIQGTIVGFGLLAAAAGPALYVIGQLILSASAIAGAFAKGGLATRALALVMGPTGLVGVMTAVRTAFMVVMGPWGVVAAAAVTLVTVLWNLAGGWDGITTALAPLGTALKNTWTFFKDIATIVIDLSGSILRGLWTWLKDIASVAVTLGKAFLEWVLTPLRTLAEWVSKIPGLSAAWGGFVSAVRGTKDAVVEAAQATGKFLNDTRENVHRVAESIRNAEIAGQLQKMKAAGLEMAVSHGGVATAVNAVTTAVKAGAPALDKNLFQTTENAKASTKAADAINDAATAYRAFINELGVREIEDATAALSALEDQARAYRGFLNQIGEQEIRDHEARNAEIADQDTKLRAIQNDLGVAEIEAEQQKQDKLKAIRQKSLDFWRQQLGAIESATIGNLGNLLFGNIGHDLDGSLKAAAQEAELDFLKIQRSGKATADELQTALEKIQRTGKATPKELQAAFEKIQSHAKSTAEELHVAFERWREAEDRANFTFGERWKQMWGGIKQTFVGILNDMLAYFTKSFIGGLIKGLVGARLGQAIGTALSGGVTGAALGAGASAAGIGGTAVGGVGAGGAAAGAGIGLGATVAITGGAAAGALLGWAIWKKGLFRGGEESLKVSPRRDQFLAQFGGPGTGPDSGFHALAAKLTSITGQPGGGSLHASLRMADSVKEWESAQAAIVGALTGAGMKGIQSFALGGFVAPGVVQPAIVHGGAFGEDIIPRTSATSGGANSRTVNFYATFQNLDPAGFERVFRKDILPRIKRATQFNTDDLAVMYGRVGASR